MNICNFEWEENLYQYFDLQFDEESEFDSFGADKSSRGPLSDSL